MQGFVPCHSSFIHKSHSLLNFLYILHTLGLMTSRWSDTIDIYISLLLEFFGCGARRLTTDCSFPLEKSCLPLVVARCTNKPATASLELETRSKDRGTGNGISGLYIRHIRTERHRQLALNGATREWNSAVPLLAKESRSQGKIVDGNCVKMF